MLRGGERFLLADVVVGCVFSRFKVEVGSLAWALCGGSHNPRSCVSVWWGGGGEGGGVG